MKSVGQAVKEHDHTYVRPEWWVAGKNGSLWECEEKECGWWGVNRVKNHEHKWWIMNKTKEDVEEINSGKDRGSFFVSCTDDDCDAFNIGNK